MSEIVYSSFVITALTFLILILSNWYIKHNDYKFIINALILSESFVLTFFFDKFTFFFGFSILLASFYYFSLSIKDASFNKNSQTLDSSFPEGLLLWFPGFGLFGIFSLLIYEYFAASNTVSANNILVILVSLSFIFYNKVFRKPLANFLSKLGQIFS